MDGPLEFGGLSSACRPMELILMGLAGCTAMDVVSILMKKRARLTDFSVEVEADRAENHPKVFTDVKLHFVFTGHKLKPAAIERAISLSQDKYCAAIAMLKQNVNITHDYEIIESGESSE
jgi:putative redox protein